MQIPTDTRYSMGIMIATWVICAIGYYFAGAELVAKSDNLDTSTLLIVFGGGFLSFVRHSIFHRSDSARLGWKPADDEPTHPPQDETTPLETGDVAPRAEFTNWFLIEVGLANLAWATLALLATVLRWGMAVQAASFVVFGLYISYVSVLLIVMRLLRHKDARPVPDVVFMSIFGAGLLTVGIIAMKRATVE